jgi:ParB-like chromosome segregation protein Spo0J
MLATIPVDLIETGERLRSISEAQVETLVNSIAEIGLLNPITVYARPVTRRNIAVDGYGVVAGAHRLEAVRRLGLADIEANVVDLGELHRQLAEVDENLAGTTLTASERALFTQRRKDIYLALHPETRQHAAGGHAKHGSASDNLSFAEETASKTGQNRRTVERDAARGSAIPDDVLTKIKGTHLDKGVFLDRIKGMDPEPMRALVKAELAPKPAGRPVPPPAPALNDYEAKNKWKAEGNRWFGRAPQEWRDEWLSEQDTAVFDRTRAA